MYSDMSVVRSFEQFIKVLGCTTSGLRLFPSRRRRTPWPMHKHRSALFFWPVRVFILSGGLAMQQAPVVDGVAFDTCPCLQDGLAASEVGVGQLILAGFEELFRPVVIEAFGYAFTPAQGSDRLLATQAFQHDTDLLFRRILFAGGTVDVLDDLLRRLLLCAGFPSSRFCLIGADGAHEADLITRGNHAAIRLRNWKCCFGTGGWLCAQSAASQSLERNSLKSSNLQGIFAISREIRSRSATNIRVVPMDCQVNSLNIGAGNFTPFSGNQISRIRQLAR